MCKIESLRADYCLIPLETVLTDSMHGAMSGFEIVTAGVRDADGAKGVGYTFTCGVKGGAIADILGGIDDDRASQMVIYPQGTRTDPGVKRAFRSGVIAMHRGTGLPIELAATNTGWFWPGHGVRRSAGTAIMSFLGGGNTAKLSQIQESIEAETRALAREAAARTGPIYPLD